ncbi:MAG: prolyl oligopeptidase family serine peptidase [Solirubrobacterales bacterium]|nr:prolyl oligopeptidase family serine peptidase [Solirubrobacterales bacterium]
MVRVAGRRCRFRLVALAIAASASLFLGASARAADVTVTDEKQVSDRLLELTIDTPAFTEPTKVHVFLPTGYDADPARRWPVTYALAGTMNNYNSFANVLGGEALTAGYPSIIVSPDGNSGYWSDWYKGGAFGPPEYETYVIDQLIPLIDARYRTIPDRRHRAVFGISMGGYGSMMVAARHPDLFGAAATISGAVDSNLTLLGVALSISSTFDGGQIDDIYGPRETQEVRWRGHNPTDLAENLRGTDLQVRTANGVLNPAIGEGDSPDDALSCVVEGGVYQGSISFHEQLEKLGVDHLWKDYGNGCHTVENFQRQVTDTLAGFESFFQAPPPDPKTFDYRSIEPHFRVWGWDVDVDPRRALEFLRLKGGDSAVTVEGSGRTSLTTPAWYRGLKTVDVGGVPVRPRADGRLRFAVDLGPAHTVQQYTSDTEPRFRTKTLKLAPHALLRITVARRVRRGARICLRAIGGSVPRARIRVGRSGARLAVGAKARCRTLRLRRPARVVTVTGRDAFGHAVKARAALRRSR